MKGKVIGQMRNAEFGKKGDNRRAEDGAMGWSAMWNKIGWRISAITNPNLSQGI
jgi:hypothetical protein